MTCETPAPDVAQWTTNLGESSQSSDIWTDLITELRQQDQRFNRDYIDLRLYFNYDMRPQHQFKSKSDYEDYLFDCGARRWDPATQHRWGVQTMKGDWVRSLQELYISNWLFIRNINYKYEAPYPIDLATAQHKQYRPDFYYPEANLFHEHFALDSSGNQPNYFDSGYVQQADWKRNLHIEYGTNLIETTSAMFSKGSIYHHLESSLRDHGIDCTRRISDEEIARHLQAQEIVPIHNTFQQFLTTWKACGKTIDEIKNDINQLSGYRRQRAVLFLKVAERLRKVYAQKLANSNEIDFQDMINMSTQHIKCGEFKHSYKLILIDEFQDISQDRSRLIKALLEQSPECRLFAVGDDWQSIYRFAGSDIGIMTGFENNYGTTAVNYLTQTFRANQGITDAATQFIEANPSQIPKKVVPADRTTKTTIKVVSHRRAGLTRFLKNELKAIVDNNSTDKPVKVLLLGRYRYEETDEIKELQQEFAEKLDISYQTVHSAKGQEADYVIVVGLKHARGGFPSNKQNDSLLDLLRPYTEEFLFAEERRLFYVALTRARQQVILCGLGSRLSPFVRELLANENLTSNDVISHVHINRKGHKTIPPPTHPLPCPECGAVLEQRRWKKKTLFGCVNYPKCKGNRMPPTESEQNASTENTEPATSVAPRKQLQVSNTAPTQTQTDRSHQTQNVRSIIRNFLSAHPQGELFIYAKSVSIWGLARLQSSSKSRKVTLISPFNMPAYCYTSGASKDISTAETLLARDDVIIRKCDLAGTGINPSPLIFAIKHENSYAILQGDAGLTKKSQTDNRHSLDEVTSEKLDLVLKMLNSIRDKSEDHKTTISKRITTAKEKQLDG